MSEPLVVRVTHLTQKGKLLTTDPTKHERQIRRIKARQERNAGKTNLPYGL